MTCSQRPTQEAVDLRKALEIDIFNLLQKYRDETGLTPNYVDAQTADVTQIGKPRSLELIGVRVTVEL